MPLEPREGWKRRLKWVVLLGVISYVALTVWPQWWTYDTHAGSGSLSRTHRVTGERWYRPDGATVWILDSKNIEVYDGVHNHHILWAFYLAAVLVLIAVQSTLGWRQVILQLRRLFSRLRSYPPRRTVLVAGMLLALVVVVFPPGSRRVNTEKLVLRLAAIALATGIGVVLTAKRSNAEG